MGAICVHTLHEMDFPLIGIKVLTSPEGSLSKKRHHDNPLVAVM